MFRYQNTTKMAKVRQVRAKGKEQNDGRKIMEVPYWLNLKESTTSPQISLILLFWSCPTNPSTLIVLWLLLYQNWYQGLREGNVTPNSSSLEKAEAKSLKKASSFFEYNSTTFLKAGSWMSTMSEGNIMSFPVESSNWSGPSQGFDKRRG